MATSVALSTKEGNKLEAVKRWGGRFLRLLQALLVVAMAAILGFYLGRSYSPSLPQWVTASLASVAGLSTLKELLSILPKAWEYVKNGHFHNLYDFSSFILLTSLALTSAFLAAQGKDSIPSQSAMNRVFFIQPAGRGTKFLVPFAKDAEGCDKKSDKFKNGLSWFDGTEKFIDQLANGLSYCATPSRPVKVEIEGFASSASFACGNSDDLNVAIANLRAQKVKGEMNKALGASANSVIVTAKEWQTDEFAQMRKGAFFNDQDAKGPVQQRGDLTRRADILVTDASDCEPK